VQALWDVSISVDPGKIVAIVGANGAGKSTLMRAISGLVAPRQGEIRLSGASLLGQAPEEIANLGIAHVPEGRGLFRQMTVLENLELGAFQPKARPHLRQRLENAYQLFPWLKERLHQKAGSLSGGEQQMLAIARATMAEPTILILDEPSLGLSPLVVQQMFKLIKALNEKGTTILLVEQNIHQALNVADHAFVLQTGSVVMHGSGPHLIADPTIRKAYLGVLE
jgi:branched-chain amino acid transport system ATP-binding protein